MSVTVHTIYTVASEDTFITVRDTDAVLQTAWDNCRNYTSPDIRWVISGGDQLAVTSIVYDLAPDYQVRVHQFYLRFDTAGIVDTDDIIGVDLYTVARWGSASPADNTEFRAGTFSDPVAGGNWVKGDDIASHALLATIGVHDYPSTSQYVNANVDQTAMRSHINKTGDTLIMGSVDTLRTDIQPAIGGDRGRTIYSADSASYDPKLVVISGTIDAPFHMRTASRAAGYANNMDVDIGEAGNDRLIVVTMDDESEPGATFQGTVTVDGKSFTQAKLAENIDGLGNHLECHTIDEATLGASAGSLNVSYSGGDNNWGMTVDVFYGVKNDTLVDSGVDDTTIGSPISISSIDSNDDALVFMAAANGSGGTFSAWTSPLTAIGAPNTPLYAVYQTAWGVETTGQTNKTYEVTAPATLQSAGIIMVFDYATSAYDESLAVGLAGTVSHANQNQITSALNAAMPPGFLGAGQQSHAAAMSVPMTAYMAATQGLAMRAQSTLAQANTLANTASATMRPDVPLDTALNKAASGQGAMVPEVSFGTGLYKATSGQGAMAPEISFGTGLYEAASSQATMAPMMLLAHVGAALTKGALDIEDLVALSQGTNLVPSMGVLLQSALSMGVSQAAIADRALTMPTGLVLAATLQDAPTGQAGLFPLANFGVQLDDAATSTHTIGLFADMASFQEMAALGQQNIATQAAFAADLATLTTSIIQHGSADGRTIVVPGGSRTLTLSRPDRRIDAGPITRNRTRI
jgi:hypothetical protein